MQVWMAAALLACTVALWIPTARDRARLRASLGFLLLWSLSAEATYWPGVALAKQIGFAFLALAAVQVIAVILFDLLLRRIALPRFASEMLIVGSYLSILFNLLYQAGVNVTGIFA